MRDDQAPWVLGISASHNGAVCLLKGDEIVVAIQEERITRIKRQRVYGAQRSAALDYCLDYAGIGPSDLSAVAICVQGRASAPINDLALNEFLQVKQNEIQTHVISHHLAHAISAFATSGFKESAVLVVDGIGSPYEDLSEDERGVVLQNVKDGWESISMYGASGTTCKPLEKHLIEGLDWLTEDNGRMAKFRSLGTIFSSSADQIFGNGLDAGKVMGLAPYGHPTIPSEEFFEIINGRFVFHDKVPERFQHREQWPFHDKEYRDLACSAQAALEKALLYLAGRLHELYPSRNFSYAGGVALNSVANERIIRESNFKNVYIIPAAEDSGPAIGAAYHALWQLTGKNTARRLVHDAVGREYSFAEIAKAVDETPGVERIDVEDTVSETVNLLCDGKIVGWFQGRSELGPRALGQRSIVCDPRRHDGKAVLNSRVKHREAFRPFAPVVLMEEAGDWFECDGVDIASPYMLRICKFREEKKDKVPAVVHVDDTGRLQTVTREANGPFYELVKKFGEKTGVPIVLNTSFNIMGMPIVEKPEDALLCMMATGIDYCVLGKTLVKKREDILLGTNIPPTRPNRNPKTYKPREVITMRPDVEDAPFLSDYPGTYTHLTGSLIINQEGKHLSATYNGMKARLDHKQSHTFVATGPMFGNTLVTFKPDKDGKVNSVSIQLRRDFGPTMAEANLQTDNDWQGGAQIMGEAIFERVETVRALDKTTLKSYAGKYEIGGRVLQVRLDESGELSVTADGQPDYKLLPGEGLEFLLQNTPGYSIEFKTGDFPWQDEAIVTQPNGIFVTKKLA
jgi:carbamoyltransferase